MRSPLLDLPGAVTGDGIDAPVAAHYGSFNTEQRTLVSGDGFVDLSHHEVVRIEGPDRLTWLHSLTTQHLLQLAPKVWTGTLVLSPNGHVEHALYGYDDGEAFTAHVEPGQAASLIEFLERMKFMTRVEITDVTADLATWSVDFSNQGADLGPVQASVDRQARAVTTGRASVVQRATTFENFRLDPPEFEAMHDEGNNRSLFDRVDLRPVSALLARRKASAASSLDPARAALAPAAVFGSAAESVAKELGVERVESVLPALRDAVERGFIELGLVIPAGYDAALRALADQVPMTIHEYPTGMAAWSWVVPEKITSHWATRAGGMAAFVDAVRRDARPRWL